MTTPTQLPEIDHPHVERRGGVQGGLPIIKGTRFPVSSIVQNYRRGLSVDEILRAFPSLTAAQVFDALSYYHDHQELIDSELAQQTDLDGAAREYPPTLSPQDDAD